MKSVWSNSAKLSGVHYDQVTEGWRRYIMGDELHVGLFSSPEESIYQATRNLTDAMAEEGDICTGHSVLDVGCGTGAVSIHLAQTYKCLTTGISASAHQVQLAQRSAKDQGVDDRVRFKLANAMDNGFPDASFDRVWVMESSHAMADKMSLFKECHRCLRPDGKIVLCDLVELYPDYSRRLFASLFKSPRVVDRLLEAQRTLDHRVWGVDSLATSDKYKEMALEAGLSAVGERNVTLSVRPTFEKWCDNVDRNYDDLVKILGEDYVTNFLIGCFQLFLGCGKSLGYYILTFRKQPTNSL